MVTHIWRFANGGHTHSYNCPCAPGSSSYPSPPFVGTNYYCESGTNNIAFTSTYYFNDLLWDGSGCITSNCCDNPTQPWFYRQLNETTTNDIEARYWSYSIGCTLIDQLEVYIQ